MKNAKERTSWDAGIYNKTTGVLLWRCGIYKKNIEVPSFSIGYWLWNSYWWEWIIPECVQALTKYAFETWGFEKWTIRCDSMNLNSQKVAIKSWFVFEWEFKKHERIQWELRDTKFFWITKEDYFSQK
jgi:RimJ/RimL family protein N-acetyltransferase